MLRVCDLRFAAVGRVIGEGKVAALGVVIGHVKSNFKFGSSSGCWQRQPLICWSEHNRKRGVQCKADHYLSRSTIAHVKRKGETC